MSYAIVSRRGLKRSGTWLIGARAGCTLMVLCQFALIRLRSGEWYDPVWNKPLDRFHAVRAPGHADVCQSSIERDGFVRLAALDRGRPRFTRLARQPDGHPSMGQADVRTRRARRAQWQLHRG